MESGAVTPEADEGGNVPCSRTMKREREWTTREGEEERNGGKETGRGKDREEGWNEGERRKARVGERGRQRERCR